MRRLVGLQDEENKPAQIARGSWPDGGDAQEVDAQSRTRSDWAALETDGAVGYSTINLSVEMFLGQKLAERKWTGQRFRSKQGLACPLFFQSIPILNCLSDRSKPVQGFSHAGFHRFLPVCSLFCLSNPFKKSSEG